MTDLSLFATPEYPLRSSALSWLVTCPVNSVLQILDPDDSSGPAADTGSMVHAAVAEFHRAKGDLNARIAAAQSALTVAAAKFPRGEITEARLYLKPYVADPRHQNCEIVAIEQRVQIDLPPHPFDTTGQPIRITGTLDQIRRVDGQLMVDDLKTGQRTGWEMIHTYAYQMAAYTLAARATEWPDAMPGRIIRAYGYRTRGAKMPSPDGVMFSMPFDVEGCWRLLDRVRIAVAMIRSGEVDYGAGAACTYCPRGGLDSCMPLANERLFGLPVIASAANDLRPI